MSIHNCNAIDRSFNAAVLHIAGKLNPRGWAVLDDAPSTLSELEAYHAKHGRLAVSSHNSGRTIWDDDEVNFAFRAWHDATHLRLSAPFDSWGERAVNSAMKRDLALLYGHKPGWFALLDAENVGQTEHVYYWGDYAVDQRSFDLAYVANGLQLPPRQY